MDQDGVEVRPIEQLTGGSEFNEVFFTGARTAADLVVGEPGEGWGVAMGLLGFERGVSTLAQQVGFDRELDGLVAWRASNGAIDDPILRDRLAPSRSSSRSCGSTRSAACPASPAARTRRPAGERPRSASWSGPTGTSGSARSRWTCSAPTA